MNDCVCGRHCIRKAARIECVTDNWRHASRQIANRLWPDERPNVMPTGEQLGDERPSHVASGTGDEYDADEYDLR
jgi:hypothetical protein